MEILKSGCNLERSLLQKGYVLNWFLGCPFLYFKVSLIKRIFPLLIL